MIIAAVLPAVLPVLTALFGGDKDHSINQKIDSYESKAVSSRDSLNYKRDEDFIKIDSLSFDDLLDEFDREFSEPPY